MKLDDEDIEAIAERVAAKLGHRGTLTAGYGDAQVVAARFGLSVDYVYAHAQKLGAIRLGAGPRARLRFNLADVERALRGSGGATKPARERRRGRPRKQRNSTVELIPFEP
jgi:hypothetical protein